MREFCLVISLNFGYSMACNLLAIISVIIDSTTALLTSVCDHFGLLIPSRPKNGLK